MMRSLYSGISGLRNHQTRMDVIGNNIANVNTAGYKTSRVIFQDIFSQNVAAGMANQGEIGGTNPTQIGLGIRLSTVDVIHSRAAFQRTDRETDMMINGDGFFIVSQMNEDGTFESFYTRAGNFDIDSEGYLVTSAGFYVLGRNVELVMGVVDEGAAAVAGRAGSSRVPANGNAAIGTWIPAGYFREGMQVPVGLFQSPVPAVPALPPAPHVVLPTETNYGVGFRVTADWTSADTTRTILEGEVVLPGTFLPGDSIPMGLLREGSLAIPGVPDGTIGDMVTLDATSLAAINTFITNSPITNDIGIPMVRTLRVWSNVPDEILRVEQITASPARDPAFGLIPGGPHPDSDINGLSRIRLTAIVSNVPVFSQLSAAQQAQYTAAMAIDDPLARREALDVFFMQFETEEVGLPGFAVADNGDVSVILGNRKVIVGRIAVAMFANPPGLEKAGNSLYRESASSGPVVLTEAFQDGAGKIDGGGLEMSNVDLANEFTDMIVTQRGFQANSRIITVSDSMLEELVNLKR